MGWTSRRSNALRASGNIGRFWALLPRVKDEQKDSFEHISPRSPEEEIAKTDCRRANRDVEFVSFPLRPPPSRADGQHRLSWKVRGRAAPRRREHGPRLSGA